MAEIFDPVSEALKLETTVKTFIDHSGHRSNPVEDSEIASTAQRQLDDQLSELWKNPEHLAARWQAAREDQQGYLVQSAVCRY